MSAFRFRPSLFSLKLYCSLSMAGSPPSFMACIKVCSVLQFQSAKGWLPCELQPRHESTNSLASIKLANGMQEEFRDLNPAFPSHYFFLLKKSFIAIKNNDFKVISSTPSSPSNTSIDGGLLSCSALISTVAN